MALRASDPRHDEQGLLEVSLERLREERPHLRAEIVGQEVALPGRAGRADAEIELWHPTKRGATRFLVEVKRTHLTYALVDGVVARYANVHRPWLLCAPYVAPPMSRYLRERGVSFIDAVGNCHIEIDGREILHHVESRRAAETQPPTHHAIRAPGYKVVFAILARPDILASPVRLIEQYAGANKSTVSNQLRRLEAEGILGQSKERYVLLRPKALFDKWVTGYADVLRPWLLIGSYETPIRDANKLEAKLESELAPSGAGDRWWWWGGASAAWRMAKHYRAQTTTIHVDDMPPDALRRLRALPAPRGSLTVLRLPSHLAIGLAPGRHLKEPVVHPLLVYAEMMTSADERTREAAELVRERFLSELR
jgi:hypothetical protein